MRASNKSKENYSYRVYKTNWAIDGKGDGLVDENENTKLSVLCIKNEE